jgi:peptide/nickel transport system ATP-binding protein
MVIKMLKQLLETGLIGSLIFITHELPLLYNVTDDIMVMYAGQIVEKATAKEAVFDPLHPYAKGLMGSIIVPESGLRECKLSAIPGVPPNLKNPPSGCRFAERCKYVRPECKGLSSISLRDSGPGRVYRCIIPEDELRVAYQKEAVQMEVYQQDALKKEIYQHAR